MVTLRAQVRISGARSRARGESTRAERAAQIARRHEQLLHDGLPALAAFHGRMARMHRRMEQLHTVAARMQESFADRLEAWDESVSHAPPTFIGSVADIVGAGSSAVALFDAQTAPTLVSTSDDTAMVAQDLEFTIGEGPLREAAAAVRPVAVAGAELRERWPQFGPAVAGLGVTAVMAVPLTQHTCLGALAVFDPPRTGPAALSSFQEVAEALTRTVLLDVQRGDLSDGQIRSPLLEEADDRRALHQAAGVVSVQLGCDLSAALALIRARAFADDEQSAAVAHRVLRGELRLAQAP